MVIKIKKLTQDYYEAIFIRSGGKMHSQVLHASEREEYAEMFIGALYVLSDCAGEMPRSAWLEKMFECCGIKASFHLED